MYAIRSYYEWRMLMDTSRAFPAGNLLLSPIRIDTFTRRGERAIVFAETERRFFGVWYSGDIHGWKVCEWYKPSGEYKSTGGSSPLDLNLTWEPTRVET